MLVVVQPLLVELVHDVRDEVHPNDLALLALDQPLLDPLSLSLPLPPSVFHCVSNGFQSTQAVHELLY